MKVGHVKEVPSVTDIQRQRVCFWASRDIDLSCVEYNKEVCRLEASAAWVISVESGWSGLARLQKLPATHVPHCTLSSQPAKMVGLLPNPLQLSVSGSRALKLVKVVK